jgi:hypothetical protein
MRNLLLTYRMQIVKDMYKGKCFAERGEKGGEFMKSEKGYRDKKN